MIEVNHDESPDRYLDMPEGLDGYWWETDENVCVPVVISKHEGNGTFSRWLEILEAKNKTIFFPTIISARLDMILRKRGYQDGFVIDGEFGPIDGLVFLPSNKD